MAVGKEITFTSSHSLPPNEDVPRDLGNGEINGHDLATELLKNGWAKVKEIKREPTEEDTKRKELETEAKNAGRGVWNPHGPKVCHFVRIECGLLVSVGVGGKSVRFASVAYLQVIGPHHSASGSLDHRCSQLSFRYFVRLAK